MKLEDVSGSGMLTWFKTLTSRIWFRAILFSFLYVFTAWVSREVSFQSASFLTLWFPSGLFIAFLLLNEVSTWPAFLLAALPANMAFWLLTGQPWMGGLLVYISTTLEACTGALLIHHFDSRPSEFRTPTHLLNLIVFAAMLGSALSATLNTTVLATVDPGLSYWATWRIAWISHALGILVIAPLILSWMDLSWEELKKYTPERLIELAILIIGLFVCSLYIFRGPYSLNRQNYMVVPFLVWVALRFGPRETSISGLVVTLISAWGLVQQLDGFANKDVTIAPNMDMLGSFLGITLITSYILSTVIDQGKRTEKALRASEVRYRMLVQNQGEGVGIVDEEEKFTFANPAANQIFGVEQLEGHSLKEFADPGWYNLIQKQTELRKEGQHTTYEIEIIQPSGKRCNLLVSANPQYDNDGAWAGTFAVFHDITERKQVEVALRDSRARLQTLFDHSPIPIWEEDFSRVKRMLDGLRREGVEDFRDFFNQHPEQIEACEQLVKVLDVNQAVMQAYQYTDKALFLAQVNKLAHRGPNDIFVEELVAIADGKTEFEMEGPNDIVDGVLCYHNVRWTVAPGYEKNYRRVIVTIIDMTERRQAEERMRYLSTHDVLTGLYNRNFFEAELERLQNSRMEPVNVMVVDVNSMKLTNDTYGHAAGDELLRRTAQVLRMSFRKEDIIARIGGDEFVVLFHGTISIQDAVKRVKDCLSEHNHWYEGASLSLGIGAASGGKGSSLVELFKKADQQMYKEKLRTRKIRPEGKKETAE